MARVVTCGGLTLEGTSVSTLETCVAVRELNLCFDIGKGPRYAAGMDHVLLTHAHQDHAVGIALHIATRKLLDLPPPVIYLPEVIVEDMRNLISAWERLERRKTRYTLVGVRPGVRYDMRKGLFFRAFPTEHSLPSTGFQVFEERKKLKPEYIGLDGPAIVELKKRGVEITDPVEIAVVTFIGDSTITPLDRFPEMLKSQVVIMECTFLAPEDRPMAKKKRHTHLADIIERADMFGCEHLVLSHFSTRYTREDVNRELAAALPESLKAKTKILY
ncbi:MAG: beta-lactamase superfamily metal-dependent [Planctomycetota bacterium]|nr:MAG: beta-lactamase superfamily metal-dependent [Planctomycetota bacterium]